MQEFLFELINHLRMDVHRGAISGLIHGIGLGMNGYLGGVRYRAPSCAKNMISECDRYCHGGQNRYFLGGTGGGGIMATGDLPLRETLCLLLQPTLIHSLNRSELAHSD